MKEKFKEIDKRWKMYALAGCVAVLFYVVLTHLGVLANCLKTFIGFFRPVIMGLIIAYLVNPLVKLIHRTLFRSHPATHGVRWTVSVFLSLLIILALLGLFIGTLVPQLVSSILSFVNNIGSYIENLGNLIENLGLPSAELKDGIAEFMAGQDSFISRIGSYLQKTLGAILRASSSVGSSAMNWLIGLITAIYVMLDRDNILRFFRHLFQLLLSEKTYARLDEVRARFDNIFSRYISFSLLDALIVGVANYIFMRITGMPDALLISIVVGVTNLAPTFGPIVGAVIGGFILLLVSPTDMILFLIFTVILQAIDGYIIKPKMFGNALAVPGVLILISIVVFGRMLGVLGILLAIPFAAILVYLYNELLIPWLEKRHAAKNLAAQGGGAVSQTPVSDASAAPKPAAAAEPSAEVEAEAAPESSAKTEA